MAMTSAVKAELARIEVTKPCCRKAEAASMLRFAGGLHIVSGRIVVEADLDSGATARRLRRDIAEIYGHAERGDRARSRPACGRAAGSSSAWSRTARRWPGRPGLLDGRGRPVRGLPPQVVSGATCDAISAWRGAFLAHGSLTEPGRSSALEVTCPVRRPRSRWSAPPAGSASRPKAREVRGVDRVVVRDGDMICALLTKLGAHESVLVWEERRMRREVRATANRLANFDDANLRRSARAAVAAGARVERALEILGDDVPDHLAVAGRLRVEHKQASLEELGQLADPPLTKDAVAGRIRRLLAMADKRAIGARHPDHRVEPHPRHARQLGSAWRGRSRVERRPPRSSRLAVVHHQRVAADVREPTPLPVVDDAYPVINMFLLALEAKDVDAISPTVQTDARDRRRDRVPTRWPNELATLRRSAGRLLQRRDHHRRAGAPDVRRVPREGRAIPDREVDAVLGGHGGRTASGGSLLLATDPRGPMPGHRAEPGRPRRAIG